MLQVFYCNFHDQRTRFSNATAYFVQVMDKKKESKNLLPSVIAVRIY
jgi:hypothetical protein